MAYQAPFRQQVAWNVYDAGIASTRTRLSAPVTACIVAAEKLGAFFIIKLYCGHKCVTFVEHIVGQFNTERFLNVDNRNRAATLVAHAHSSQTNHLVAGSVVLIEPFAQSTSPQTKTQVVFDNFAWLTVKGNLAVFQ